MSCFAQKRARTRRICARRSTSAETRAERARRVYTAMTTRLSITVDIDAESVLNLVAHAVMAVESGVMTSRGATEMILSDVGRFVRASARPAAPVSTISRRPR